MKTTASTVEEPMKTMMTREERSGLDVIVAGDGTIMDALDWKGCQKKMRSGSVLSASSCPFIHNSAAILTCLPVEHHLSAITLLTTQLKLT